MTRKKTVVSITIKKCKASDEFPAEFNKREMPYGITHTKKPKKRIIKNFFTDYFFFK